MSSIIHYALWRFARWARTTYEPGVDDPWFLDNFGHFACGVTIGALAHHGAGFGLAAVGASFLACALVWEAYEFAYNIRPWDERENWTFDRAIEDTMLDIYVGLTGALLVVLL